MNCVCVCVCVWVCMGVCAHAQVSMISLYTEVCVFGCVCVWACVCVCVCQSLRALTYESERTLDLPRHGAERVCPWLSTPLVVGSVRREIRRGRGGNRYGERRS